MTAETRTCAAITRRDTICGEKLVQVSPTRWEHANRIPVFDHQAVVKLAHPADLDPFAGLDQEEG